MLVLILLIIQGIARANLVGSDGINLSHLWQCPSSDATVCYRIFLYELNKRYKAGACNPDYCARAFLPSYRQEIDSILSESIQKSTKDLDWNDTLEYAANLALEKASKCDMDYTIILSLQKCVLVIRKQSKIGTAMRKTSESLLDSLLASSDLYHLNNSH